MFVQRQLASQAMFQTQLFGFSTLRKRLGLFSFKLTKQRKFKNPHAMTLRKRQDLLKEGYKGQLKIQETERLSARPFGTLTSKGRFKLDIDKVPFFNIPNLDGFALKPYVSHATAKVDPESFEPRRIHLTPEMLAEIEEKIKNQPKELEVKKRAEYDVASWHRPRY